MDECREKPVSSTKMGISVDGETWLSTIRAVYVDKWQKKWLTSTYRPEFMDGETRSSMKTALSVDGYGPKVGLITLKEVDTANTTIVSIVPGIQSHVAPWLLKAIPATG